MQHIRVLYRLLVVEDFPSYCCFHLAMNLGQGLDIKKKLEKKKRKEYGF